MKIYEILKRDSDEDSPLATPLLIKKLKEIGIECERKILYEDIKELNAYGYEVMMTRTQTNNYYIMDRGFDVPELRILMDAVESAKFITMSKTCELKDKIAALGGSFRGELLKTNQAQFNVKKHTNEEIYYTVSILDSAIYNKK